MRQITKTKICSVTPGTHYHAGTYEENADGSTTGRGIGVCWGRIRAWVWLKTGL